MKNTTKKAISSIGILGILAIGLLFIAPISVSAAIDVNYGGVTYTVDDKGNFSGGGITGTIDWSSGDIKVDGGGEGNITSLQGAEVSADVGGGTVSAVIDEHSYDYQAEMWRSGYQYVEAAVAGDIATMESAVDRANQAIQNESGGTQQTITSVANSNGSISYGCINVQNTTIAFNAKSVDGSGNPSGVAVPSGNNTNGGGSSVNNDVGNVNGNGNNGSNGDDNNGTNGNNNNGNGSGNGVTATLSANPTVIDTGQSSTISWNSANAIFCAGTGFTAGGSSGSVSTGVIDNPGAYNYQVTCSGEGGNSTPAFATLDVRAPNATISANPTRVSVGGSSTVTWSASQVNSCVVSGPGLSSTSLSGSQSVTINTQSTFRITCQTNGTPITSSFTANVVPRYQEF